MNISTIICVVLGIWLLFATIAIIVIGCDDHFSAGEWLATLMFIFVPPLWAIIFSAFRLEAYNKHRKIKKRRKELGLDKEENNDEDEQDEEDGDDEW